MAKILIVEDEETIADELDTWLVREHHTVDVANTGNDGLYRLKHFDYDLAIIDWNLPDIQGVDVCKLIRNIKPQIPLLMLTSRRDINDKVAGLDAGAQDYIVKPCALAELSARIRALLRRTLDKPSTGTTFADLELNPDTRMCFCRGAEFKLSHTEFDILIAILNRGDGMFYYKEIARSIGKENDDGLRDKIRTRIKTLRQKLKQTGSRASIEFNSEQGYTLVEHR